MKKVAVVGAVAYGGYKLGQLSTRFDGFGNNFNPGYNFNQWKIWREADGFLCRNSNDCNWLDRNLECEPVRNFGWNINVRLLYPLIKIISQFYPDFIWIKYILIKSG